MFQSKERFKQAFLEKLQTLRGVTLEGASDSDKYIALSNLVREYISKNWAATNNTYLERGEKQIYYFSIEFLLGRLLHSNLLNIDQNHVVRDALQELDIDLARLEEKEPDAGLGNGGLGRLAACFLDSMASLNLPGHGCGIRYKYGLFEQKIVNGYQVELPDNWLQDGNVWEYRKPEKSVEVRFGGYVREAVAEGVRLFIHEGYEAIRAVPYDMPVVGYQNKTVNTLRLWSAEAAPQDFDFSSFNRGEYLKAIEYKYSVEAISEILYPDDSYQEGQKLRLKQQYFFVSAGIQSIVRRYKRKNGSVYDFEDKIAIHINDTHPALAVPELMRILMDDEGLGWDEAWRITSNTISYTNHTVLPEALEKWPVEMFKELLPRIYMIVHEINERFCRELWDKYPGDWDRIARMAIVANGYVHMAHLAIVGSDHVNGVAHIHTEILKKQVMRNFYELSPHKFSNKTNGITHRRWLLKANPLLAKLITDTIGASWITFPGDLVRLEHYAGDAAWRDNVRKVKLANKNRLAQYIKRKYDITINPASIFDVHVKRIHAYKRQLLNVFHIMDLYNRLRVNPDLDVMPRTFIFGGKSAPGYFMAKRTIKLINTLAEMVNQDQSIGDKLKVVFMENYGVSLAEMIIPAADISEQISTASKEASGTGNMKFMMNGAITLGTLDGANIEIRNAVGAENFISFGLTAEQVLSYYAHGGYNAWDVYNSDERIQVIMDQLVNLFFPVAKEEFRTFYDTLLHSNDEFFVLQDFASYVEAQNRVSKLYQNEEAWGRMAAANIAHSGQFSSDKTIMEYAIGIWNVKPVVVK
ncbi:phosphorylase pyridoxal-phosphate attachment site [Lucifera butyrica]|uniref:Alpha-1,4 glucan phosphorylase n=1 Tax=Lucifera butyrica TaxID=1351585 RepID=A0A498R2N2_9FIRM|nr:glycogen/starch/alpha-glucan phosphorylase [Lucifera butyrica]VBB05020.1 phosphorylase pyridoxal-phosphate attachment site [Lucifera butyrica]